MRATYFRKAQAGAVMLGVLALAAAACAQDRRSPTAPVTPTPAAARTVSLLLEVPEGIEPGQSVQLSALAFRSDGTREDVSSQARWTVSDPAVLEISAAGVATGRTYGETTVRAVFDSETASRMAFVVPRDTFRLRGTIRNSGFGIANVMVTVIDGTGEGLQSISNASGFYALYGVRGPVRLQLKKDGYDNGIHQVDVPGHHAADFTMVPVRPPVDYSGSYTLTIAAVEPCLFYPTPPLPAEARRRQYTAHVAQSGPALTITLNDADMIVSNGHGNRFSGFVDGADMFWADISKEAHEWDPYALFDIVERLGDGALAIAGVVTARGNPQRVAGTLNGSILTSPNAGIPLLPPSALCYSDAHFFEMVRR